jgi:hypothetical protein
VEAVAAVVVVRAAGRARRATCLAAVAATHPRAEALAVPVVEAPVAVALEVVPAEVVALAVALEQGEVVRAAGSR